MENEFISAWAPAEFFSGVGEKKIDEISHFKELEQSLAMCISTKTVFSVMTDGGHDKIVYDMRLSYSRIDTQSGQMDSAGSRLRIS